jgi:predicted amidohydrolase YtcJ
MSLVIRNVEVAGRAGLDVRLKDGRIAAIGERLPGGGETLDGAGGALIPGLADHHIHLFALAAQASSVALAGVAGPAPLRRASPPVLRRRPLAPGCASRAITRPWRAT